MRGAGLSTSDPWLMASVLPEDDKRESSTFITHRSGGNTSSSGQVQGSRQKSNTTCHYCGKPGHLVRVCKTRLAHQQQGNCGHGGGFGLPSVQKPNKKMYAVGIKLRLDAWYLDLASEWHITYDMSELEDVRAVQREKMFTVVGYDGSRISQCTLVTVEQHG
ncbi:hypothetical protein VaNZ11_009465 [Volvox africanus]|uniref:CCHC-type domain-containing protein n=1 Tax=Volvox africanus TaxID=51714 RepID=A0ABQ5S7E0_9CHLO|nr:hypothetical protein VaNZ11_009465 [Volvox africanus]